MIRVVLAVVLSVALFGIAVPSAEAVDRDRSAALALAELETIDGATERLASRNDPVTAAEEPAATTLRIGPPDSTFVDPGTIRIDDGDLQWVSEGRNETVSAAVPIVTGTPIVLSEPTRIRLSLIRFEGEPAVRIRIDHESV